MWSSVVSVGAKKIQKGIYASILRNVHIWGWVEHLLVICCIWLYTSMLVGVCWSIVIFIFSITRVGSSRLMHSFNYFKSYLYLLTYSTRDKRWKKIISSQSYTQAAIATKNGTFNVYGFIYEKVCILLLLIFINKT